MTSLKKIYVTKEFIKYTNKSQKQKGKKIKTLHSKPKLVSILFIHSHGKYMHYMGPKDNDIHLSFHNDLDIFFYVFSSTK